MTDIHELRTLHEHKALLVAELQHRTRNLLGIVRSVSDATIKSSESLAAFQKTFGARLGALSRVQGLLSHVDDPISLDELVRIELSAHGVDELDGRVQITGPLVVVHAKGVQTLALALHELATNALKYGALSIATGRLSIRSSLSAPRGTTGLIWQESGVPIDAAASSNKTGFGRRLLERAIPHDLGAEVVYEVSVDGIMWKIELPTEIASLGKS